MPRYPITKLSAVDQTFASSLPLSPVARSACPILRTLTDSRGRAKLVFIEGRTQFDLFFQVFGESKNHTFPINRLSPQDRNFVFSLPVTR